MDRKEAKAQYVDRLLNALSREKPEDLKKLAEAHRDLRKAEEQRGTSERDPEH